MEDFKLVLFGFKGNELEGCSRKNCPVSHPFSHSSKRPPVPLNAGLMNVKISQSGAGVSSQSVPERLANQALRNVLHMPRLEALLIADAEGIERLQATAAIREATSVA